MDLGKAFVFWACIGLAAGFSIFIIIEAVQNHLYDKNPDKSELHSKTRYDL